MSTQPYSDNEMMAAFRVLQRFHMPDAPYSLIETFELMSLISRDCYYAQGNNELMLIVLENHGRLITALNGLVDTKIAFERDYVNEDTLYAVLCQAVDAAEALKNALPEPLQSQIPTGNVLENGLEDMLRQMDDPIRDHHGLHAQQVERMRDRAARDLSQSRSQR